MAKSESSLNIHRRAVCGAILLGAIQFVCKAELNHDVQTGQSYFLLPEDFNIETLKIELPPADDMAEARIVLAKQSQLSASRIAQIKAEAVNPLPLFWQCAGLSESSYPEQSRKMMEAVADTESVVIALKQRFNRARPNAILRSIHAVVPVPAYASYPSGHATQSIVIATILSEVAPKAATRLKQLATQVGRNRELAGLHYPSDTNAGFKLGHDLSKIFLPRVAASFHR